MQLYHKNKLYHEVYLKQKSHNLAKTTWKLNVIWRALDRSDHDADFWVYTQTAVHDKDTWRVATSSVVPQRPSSMGKGDAGDDNNDDKNMF